MTPYVETGHWRFTNLCIPIPYIIDVKIALVAELFDMSHSFFASFFYGKVIADFCNLTHLTIATLKK